MLSKSKFFNLSTILTYLSLQQEILSVMETSSISMIKRAGPFNLDINQTPPQSPTNEQNVQSSSHNNLNLFPILDSTVEHNKSPDIHSTQSGNVGKKRTRMPIEERRKRQAEAMREKRKRVTEICNGINCEGISEEQRKFVIQQKEKERKGKQERKKKIRFRINNGNPTQADLNFLETEKRNKAHHNETHKRQNYEKMKEWHAKNPGKHAQYAAKSRKKKKMKIMQEAENQ